MTGTYLILVTGLPCSGKTILANRIAEEFRLPLLTKDGVKELLFDTLGWSDRAWSKKLSKASNRLLIHVAQAILSGGQSLVLESNFPPEEFSEYFISLQRTCVYTPIQILCYAQGEELIYRFRHRWESGQRHPGHVDDQSFEEISKTLVKGKIAPLNIGNDVIEIDTTDFERIDITGLFADIRHQMNPIPPTVKTTV